MGRPLLLLCAALCLSGCAAADPVATKPAHSAAQPAAKPAAQAPAWTEGEVPAEQAFYGVASAPLGEDKGKALEAARAKATEKLKQEFGILLRIVKHDHSEQVAEIVTRYPTDQFDAHADACAQEALGKVELVESFEDKAHNPPLVHVLVKLTPEALFEAMDKREGLPDEQKARLRNYKNSYTKNVMINLGR